MVAHYKYPHSVINTYLAESLDEAGILDKSMTVMRGGKPVLYGTIVGEEMVPEFSSSSVAANNYIVFQVARDDNEHTEWQKNETILYNVYTKGKLDGLSIMDGITDALGRRDFTTDDLMFYQMDKKGFESFHFFDIEYNILSTAAAMNNGKEAGYYLGTVLVSYAYTYDMDDRGKRLKM